MKVAGYLVLVDLVLEQEQQFFVVRPKAGREFVDEARVSIGTDVINKLRP
jgi:hypothetical protein